MPTKPQMWVCSFAGYPGFRFQLSGSGIYEGFNLLNHLVPRRATRCFKAPVLALRQIETKPFRRLLYGGFPFAFRLRQGAVVMPQPAFFKSGNLVIRWLFGLRGCRERFRCHGS